MIPALKDWLDGTSVTGRGRSPELKRVDDAIRDYHAARTAEKREAIGAAWNAWKQGHTSETKIWFVNKRNKAGLFEILEAEFAPAGLTSPQPLAMSRLALDFAAKPPGFANVDDDLMRDRIDKAFIDAQGVLRTVLRRLGRGDAETVANVRLWFGKTSPGTLAERYEKLQAHMEHSLKRGKTPLEIRFDDTPKNSASTAYKAQHMSFGPVFFDDDKTVPSANLAGKPMPQPDYLIKAKAVIAEWDALDAANTTCGLVEAKWGEDAATLGDHVLALGKKGNAGTSQEIRARLDKLGFNMNLRKEEARAKAATDKQRNSDRKDEMLRAADANRLAVSASGVVIHELTHMVLDTQDLRSPLFATLTPCYGPGLCLHLASQSAENALNNADNYRLFAECCLF